jgi:hypothetical protein
VAPTQDKIGKYISDFGELIKDYKNPNFWIIGKQTRYVDQTKLPAYINIFTSIKELTNAL